MRRVTRRLNKV